MSYHGNNTLALGNYIVSKYAPVGGISIRHMSTLLFLSQGLSLAIPRISGSPYEFTENPFLKEQPLLTFNGPVYRSIEDRFDQKWDAVLKFPVKSSPFGQAPMPYSDVGMAQELFLDWVIAKFQHFNDYDLECALKGPWSQGDPMEEIPIQKYEDVFAERARELGMIPCPANA